MGAIDDAATDRYNHHRWPNADFAECTVFKMFYG